MSIDTNKCARHRLKAIPNALTIFRIILLIPLGYLAFNTDAKAFGLLLIAFWLTDFLDGISARLLGATSSLGAELDSIADSVGGVAVTFYLYVLFPPVFGEILPYLIITGFLGTIYICLALYKIGRIGLHFWSAKLMGVTTFVFQVHTSLVGFNRVVFYVWIATFTLAMTEQILALLLGTPTYRTKSIFEVLP